MPFDAAPQDHEHGPHDAVEDLGSNRSTSPHIDEVVARRYSRRSVMKGGTAAAALTFFGGLSVAGATPAAAGPNNPGKGGKPSGPLGAGPAIGFTAVPTSTADTVVVPPEYTVQVLVPWGTPLFPGVPDGGDASGTAEQQAQQVGFNHDGMHYFPLANGPAGSRRGILVFNNEYTDASQIYSAAAGSAITGPQDLWKVKKALAAHGVTAVEVQMQPDGTWTHVVGSRFNRRVHGETPVAFSGPVRLDHPMLQSSNPPLGTLNNCAHGYTPWGTYLACEENWNGYFGTDNAGTKPGQWQPTELEGRYGVTAGGFGYAWHKASERFDLAKNRNELNRFGWVVEIDPSNPSSTPVKRTALGRIKHESATVTEGRGRRVVVYTGDDENLDYVYKFVGDGNWVSVRARGRSPLDEGTLYVARFDADGTGTWLPLVHGQGPLTPANGWVDQADVLLRTRQAADAVDATRLHRPEWVSVDERTKDVYLTLTNGSATQLPGTPFTREVRSRDHAANGGAARAASNPFGHILRWREAGGDNAALTFSWDIFTLAGDPKYAGDVPPNTPPPGGWDAVDARFGSPDGIWVDDDSRVWIQTDISNGSQNRADRSYDRIANNSMLVANPVTGEIKRFLTGPRGCEITGIITTPDQRTMFVNVQHPGERTDFWNPRNGGVPTTDEPGRVSNWPQPPGVAVAGPPTQLPVRTVRPRPATVVIRRKDGGVIGS